MKEHILRELLLDAIVPIPVQEVTKILECAYGESQIFKELDKFGKTVSLGQMHFGKLNDGTEVAVKIQHPEIFSVVGTDLNIMEWFHIKRIWNFLNNITTHRSLFRENMYQKLIKLQIRMI